MSPQPEQKHRLDQLNSLVHQGGAVDGDLRSHAPHGVLQGHLRRDILQVFEAPVPERPPRRRKVDFSRAFHLPVKALPYGVVLTVQGTELIALQHQGHDPRSTHHDALFVCQRDLLPGLQGFLKGADGRRAGGGKNHVVDLRGPRDLQKSRNPAENAERVSRKLLCKGGGGGLVGKAENRRPELGR